ncbi:MAG TPA: hypothetical protein VIP70_12475 [Nitrososphaeraceae archaeon]
MSGQIDSVLGTKQQDQYLSINLYDIWMWITHSDTVYIIIIFSRPQFKKYVGSNPTIWSGSKMESCCCMKMGSEILSKTSLALQTGVSLSNS